MASRDEMWAAADALVKAGGRPTLAAVRKAVGGGSFRGCTPEPRKIPSPVLTINRQVA
ncbi:MAG: DNA-binding protein [Pigmentiphaga sp.]